MNNQRKKLLNGTPFLLHDSGNTLDRILIFSPNRNLDLMFQCPHWFAYGTFKASHPLFSQVSVKYSNVIPTVVVLMPNKSDVTYTRVLNALKNLNANLNPTSIMTDFKQAAIKAFRKAFPGSTQRGCFFHLSQCIYRQIQSYPDCKERYATDSEFAHQIRQLACVAFVPLCDVVKIFEELIDSEYFIENSDVVTPIVNYFEDNWIRRLSRRNQRQNPLFPHSLWNCYESTLEDLPKTNNSVEG
jgi:hypothetical protein